jgi:hypothetical protein
VGGIYHIEYAVHLMRGKIAQHFSFRLIGTGKGVRARQINDFDNLSQHPYFTLGEGNCRPGEVARLRPIPGYLIEKSAFTAIGLANES